jgi:hypothetical protein
VKPDTFTRTEADAAAYERDRASDRHLDDRPTRAQIEADERADYRPDLRYCPACNCQHAQGDPFCQLERAVGDALEQRRDEWWRD